MSLTSSASRAHLVLDAWGGCGFAGEKFVHVLETLDARAQTRGDVPPKILAKGRS